MQGFGAQHIQKTDTGIVDRLVVSSTMTAMDKGNWKKIVSRDMILGNPGSIMIL
jgi:hypothetical protein